MKHLGVSAADPSHPDLSTFVIHRPGAIAMDTDWQFPAVTEQHAWIRLSSPQLRLPTSMLYVAFPWATLIDKLHSKAPDRDFHLGRFERFCELLPKSVRKVTVCQHIQGRKYQHLFHQAGIDDVFWSHTTHTDVASANKGGDSLRFHPFPLYPVQVPEALPEAGSESDALPRKYLFSFIGARANEYYLTESRNLILDILAADPRGLILGRDSWHYQKVVYDFQIKGGVAEVDAAKLVDTSASNQFRESLLQSTFSLCPSGSGPNSIRLWESIGAGAIPVILADTWAPPGDSRLWDMATVFCKEASDEIRALPDRLAEIANDPNRLVQMRHAMRQIWLLYGPDAFVTDVQDLILSNAAYSREVATGSFINWALAEGDARRLLIHCASALLLEPSLTLARLQADERLSEALVKACDDLPEDAAARRHYDEVFEQARRMVPMSAPVIKRGAPPKICFLGRHSNRTPLSYAPIRRLIGDRLETVETPAAADLILSGFNIDLRENINALRSVLETPRPPRLAIISEEPLWDITWSGPFNGRQGRISVEDTEIAYTFLSHETSEIYDFKHVPYFVLTSDTYAVRYANLMARFAAVTPKMLLARWRNAAVSAAFFIEKRKGSGYSEAFPERDVMALSAFRTEVAERTRAPGVLRAGKGWYNDARRQDLPDWHLDKLAKTDGRTKVLGAFENVHQRLYITEKIFDAFAVGAVPTYWAGPGHRIFDLVPAAALMNCHGLEAESAAQRITNFSPDAAFAEAWLETCRKLSALFGNSHAIESERRRVAETTLDSLLSLA